MEGNIQQGKRKYKTQRATQDNNTLRNPTNNHTNWRKQIVGDIMDMTNQDYTFRIYFQNVNSLAVGKGTQKWEDMIQEMTTRQVSECGFAETNTEWQAEKQKQDSKQNYNTPQDKQQWQRVPRTLNSRQYTNQEVQQQ